MFQPEEQSRRFAKARKLMAQFATGLIEEKRRELEGIGGAEKMPRRKGGDFLTLLVEANMGNLLPEGQRLSDQEIIDGTFHMSTGLSDHSPGVFTSPRVRVHNVSVQWLKAK